MQSAKYDGSTTAMCKYIGLPNFKIKLFIMHVYNTKDLTHLRRADYKVNLQSGEGYVMIIIWLIIESFNIGHH